ncbi:hypothetical protein GCM10008905_30680 [Clostridium malenominatum]|uniref:Uncharacterized protein n=1 Tax=Clostridium malenominatum TaxID=1539 RepID=A0ABN1J674_9CLOT
MRNKSMFGKTVLGVERSTFLIDEEGILKKIYRKVSVQNHIEELINFLSK